MVYFLHPFVLRVDYNGWISIEKVSLKKVLITSLLNLILFLFEYFKCVWLASSGIEFLRTTVIAVLYFYELTAVYYFIIILLFSNI